MEETKRTAEPTIIVNGTRLSDGQAMTVRTALENFASTLAEEGLGSDQHGAGMVKNYLARIEEIREIIFE